MQIYLSTKLYQPTQYDRLLKLVRYLEDQNVGIEIVPEWQDPIFINAIKLYYGEMRTYPISVHGPSFQTEASSLKGTKSYKNTLYYFKETMALAQMFQGKYIVFHHNNCPFIEEEKEEMIQVSTENLQFLNEMASKYHTPLVVENAGVMAHKDMLFNEVEFVKMANEISNPILFDIGHAHANGWNIERVIKRLAPKIVAYHVHNNNGFEDEHNRMFKGTLDMNSFWNCYKTYTPNADIVLEYGQVWQNDEMGIIEDVRAIREILHISYAKRKTKVVAN